MASLSEIVRQLRWSVERRGLWDTVGVTVQRLTGKRKDLEQPPHPFDVEHGVETSGLIGGGKLGGGHEHGRFIVAYYGVQPSRFREALRRWRETPGTGEPADWMFVDMGAGKGRAMMMASQQGFGEVVGVELDEGVAEIGENNLRAWQAAGKARCPVKLIRGDATEFERPEGPVLVFLYNPFHAPVLRRLLTRLTEPEARGRIDVLYMVPDEAAVFGEFPRFELLWSEVTEISEEDARVDLVATPEDRCNLYRFS